MLVLCRSSCEVVVTEKELDGPDMLSKLLGKRQRLAHQARNSWSQCIIEPLNVMGFPRPLPERPVLRRGSHSPRAATVRLAQS